MASLEYHKDQLQVGNEIISNISNSITDFRADIDVNVERVKSAALKFKVNLGETIQIDKIDEIFTCIDDNLEATSEVAIMQSDLVEKFNSGELKNTLNEQFVSDFSFLKHCLYTNSNSINPNVGTRVVATVGMGVFKFGEGFFEFFEDIGDCAVLVGSGVVSLVGFDSLSKKLSASAAEDKVATFVENTDAFEWINDNSYFDKDSHYANIWKLAGKATGAVATGKVVSLGFGKLGAQGVSKFSNLSDDVLKTVSEGTAKYGSTTSTFGSNVTSNLQQGHSLKSSVAYGGLTTATSLGIAKGVTAPVSKAVSDKIVNTSSDKFFGKALDGVGSFANKTGQKAENIFPSKFVSNTKSFADTALNSTVREGKTTVTDNMVHDDGNVKTTEDVAVSYGVGTSIDIGKNTVGQTFEKTVLKTAEGSVEKEVVKTATKFL